MNKVKILFVSFMTMIMFIGTAFGQKTEEDKIRDIIESFTSDIEALRSEGAAKAPAIFSYVSNDFKFDSKKINTMNVVLHETFDLKKIKLILNQLKATNLTLDRTLGPLDEVYVRDKAAFARYYNDYELFESDRVISKGRQYVDLIFRKSESGWKITWMVALDIDGIEYKGMCLCEIYENNGLKNIMTETIVPNGSSIYLAKDKFVILSDQEPRLVRHEFREYEWYKNGAVHVRNVDGTKGKALGSAKSRQELLLSLLKKEIYPDRCFTVVRKLK